MLIQLVTRIQLAEGSQVEIESAVNLFLSNVPDPQAINYLSQKEYDDLTAEEIVDKALAFKPTLL